MKNQRFDQKHPLESKVLTFDFTPALSSSETLVSGASAAVTFVGVDPSPGTILAGPVVIDPTGKLAYLPVIGGIDGCDYLITIVCTSSNAAKVPVLNAVLPVRT